MSKGYIRDKECIRCKSTIKLTRDHLIPKWLYNKAHVIGFPFKKTLGVSNFQTLCHECNQKKGGRIEWEHELVREYMKKLSEWIDDNLSKSSG